MTTKLLLFKKLLPQYEIITNTVFEILPTVLLHTLHKELLIESIALRHYHLIIE